MAYLLAAHHVALAGGAEWDPGGAQHDLLALGGALHGSGRSATGPALSALTFAPLLSSR